MRVNHFHNEVSDCAFEQRDTALLDEAHLKALDCAPREMIAEMLVIFRQNADAVAAHDGKNSVHVGAIVERHQNQRRVEGYGSERVGGHAVRAVFVTRGDHRDAGGEAAERVTKSERV